MIYLFTAAALVFALCVYLAWKMCREKREQPWKQPAGADEILRTSWHKQLSELDEHERKIS